MSVTTTAVSTYIRNEKDKLLAKSVAGANTFAGGFTMVMPDIKRGSQKSVKFFSNTLGYQYETGCADVSGSTVFTEKLLSTELITVYDKWCVDDLSSKLAAYLPAGANSTESFDIPTEVVDDIIANIAEKVAITAWQGKRKTPTNAMEANIKGWLYRLINNGASSYSGSTFKTSTPYTAITSANFLTATDDLMANVPTAIATKNLELRCPIDFFSAGKVAYRNTYGAGSLEVVPGDVNSYKLLGYDNVTVRYDEGLTGSKCAVLAVAGDGNFLWNVDLASDIANIDIWFSPDTDTVRYRVKYAIGTEIKFPEEVGILNYNTGSLAN